MRMLRCLMALVLVTACILGCAATATQDRDTLYQFSTINALLDGHYHGEITIDELGKKGDFGIGTLHGLDGELVALDGEFYKVAFDGQALLLAGAETAPFAMVTFFEPDTSLILKSAANFEALEAYLDDLLPSRNLFYAIKIEGRFDYVKARSVAKQEVPYPPLIDVVKDQSIFEFEDVEGVMVGFWTPCYIQGVNLPGYHLHFITADRQGGGHVLGCSLANVTVHIDYTSRFYMELPGNQDFLDMDLCEHRQEELEQAE